MQDDDAAPDRRDADAWPLTDFDQAAPRRRWRGLAITGLVLVLLAGGYAAAAWATADRVPPGTMVAGVDIGGLQADAAVQRLEEGLAEASTAEIPVVAGERTTSFDPAEAGLAFDAEATVAELTGFTLAPERMWQQVFGSDEHPPVTDVDADLLEAAVAELADSLRTPPVEGGIVLADDAAHPTPAADGLALDPAATSTLLREGWLTASRPIELPTVVEQPQITQQEVDRAMAEIARPLTNAPVTVAVEGQIAELPVSVLVEAATIAAEGDELVLRMDGELLAEEVAERTEGLLTEAADARFVFVDGEPVIEPGEAGTTLDPDQVADAVATAAVSAERTAHVELVESDPEQGTEELEALGITERIAHFSTRLTADRLRTENIRIGASKVSGTLLRPGEEFSLLETLGPITREAGYHSALVIVNGEYVQGTGGGLSQLATTVYNAAFFAGLEDVEHQPHSYYISRYPEGREATIYEGAIDLKFRNNTPYGVLLQSWVGGGEIHVAVWSTPYWEVKTSTSGRSNVVAPKTIRSSSPTCTPQSAGPPGFSVTVTRQLLLDGEVVKTERNSWRYRPQDAVVCTADEASDDEASSDED